MTCMWVRAWGSGNRCTVGHQAGPEVPSVRAGGGWSGQRIGGSAHLLNERQQLRIKGALPAGGEEQVAGVLVGRQGSKPEEVGFVLRTAFGQFGFGPAEEF